MRRPAREQLTRLRRFKWPTVAFEVAKNAASIAMERRGGLRALTAIGAIPDEPANRVAYSRSAFNALLAHARLTADDVAGLRVLELGPGRHPCVALRFLAAGAAKVTCIDRFSYKADPPGDREVYRLLLADLDDEGRRRLDGLVSPDGELLAGDERLEMVRGVGIEEGAERLAGQTFDAIMSVAVLEHVYDVAASFRAMDALLAAGGLMIHQVDLRDHGMFSNGGRHPLEFLTIGERVYRMMTSHTGAPNRERIGTYRSLLAGLGYESDIEIANVGGAREDLQPYRLELVPGRDVDQALLASIERLRTRMPPRFAALPADELAVTGILIRSRKAPDRSAVGTAAASQRA